MKSKDEEIHVERMKVASLEIQIKNIEISRDTEIKKLREDIQRAYDLITQAPNGKSPEAKCISWNKGFGILRYIIKDGE